MYQKIQMINKFRPTHYKLAAVLNQQGNYNKLAQFFQVVQHAQKGQNIFVPMKYNQKHSFMKI